MTNLNDIFEEIFNSFEHIDEKLEEELNNLFANILNLKLYNGTQIIRWNSRNYIRSENDCEHQNIVSHITIYLCEKYKINDKTSLCAIGLASIHDMFEYAEGGMGDIPHSVKAKSPEIRKIVETHEEETILSVPYIGDAWKRYSSDELAVSIVNFADQLDVLLYISREFSLGNKDEDFYKIFALAYQRVLKCYEELTTKLRVRETF